MKGRHLGLGAVLLGLFFVPSVDAQKFWGDEVDVSITWSCSEETDTSSGSSSYIYKGDPWAAVSCRLKTIVVGGIRVPNHYNAKRSRYFGGWDESLYYYDQNCGGLVSRETGLTLDSFPALGPDVACAGDSCVYLEIIPASQVKSSCDTEQLLVGLEPCSCSPVAIGWLHVIFPIETGFEFNLVSFLIKNKEVFNLSELIFGFPSFYVSFPFEVEVFANKIISLIIGVEPVLRFVLNYFSYNNVLWLEYLDETRGFDFKYFRYNIGNYTVLDLFFYDMPVYIGVRFKI
ncbi:MAG: hypothetical protein ABSA97_08970 [Verrucomicrobiia bacterium]